VARPSLEFLLRTSGRPPDFVELSLPELQTLGARELLKWKRAVGRLRPGLAEVVLQVRLFGQGGRLRWEETRAAAGELIPDFGIDRVILSGGLGGTDPQILASGSALLRELEQSFQGLPWHWEWPKEGVLWGNGEPKITWCVDPLWFWPEPALGAKRRGLSPQKRGLSPGLRGFYPHPALSAAIPGVGSYLKLHGWLEERWLRILGQEQINALSQGLPARGFTHLCLAHSQRENDFGNFP
jgi:hypothetical protein